MYPSDTFDRACSISLAVVLRRVQHTMLIYLLGASNVSSLTISSVSCGVMFLEGYLLSRRCTIRNRYAPLFNVKLRHGVLHPNSCPNLSSSYQSSRPKGYLLCHLPTNVFADIFWQLHNLEGQRPRGNPYLGGQTFSWCCLRAFENALGVTNNGTVVIRNSLVPPLAPIASPTCRPRTTSRGPRPGRGPCSDTSTHLPPQ